MTETREIEGLHPSVPRPVGIRMVVRPLPKENKTKGGLIITEDTMEMVNYMQSLAQVVAVGPDAYTDTDRFPNGPWCKPGDIVLIHPHEGQTVEVQATAGSEEYTRFKVINQDGVRAIIQNPDSIRIPIL